MKQFAIATALGLATIGQAADDYYTTEEHYYREPTLEDHLNDVADFAEGLH